MDESWRMKMTTTSVVARRRASADSISRTSAELGRRSGLFRGSDAANINFEDFNDVFGGPPRSVLSKKLSCDFSSYDYFYREIFRRQEDETERSSRRSSRLPEFTIPLSHRAEDKDVFYTDTFKSSGNCNHHDDNVLREKKSSSSSRMWRSLSKPNWISKSKSKSKSNSSSALSYEEISRLPIQPGVREEDDGLNSFSSKLRPLNVPCRWNSSSETREIHNNETSEPPFQYTNASYIGEGFMRLSNPCFSQQFPSPEAEISYSTTVGISVDDVDDQLEPPSSAKSVFCNDPEASNTKFQFNESAVEEDELSSSYVIEINSGRREVTNEAADIDEAIAWAKGKFQACGSSGEEQTRKSGEEKSMVPLVMEVQENVSERYPLMSLYMEEGLHHSSMQKENDCTGELLETGELDERIDSWSVGKETNIRLLLSTLHHVLWASSGWNAVPFPNVIEHSQVKKAYQKARLCIHPDKLQQRSASNRQKYIAQKTFSILQNAWDSFISQEIVSR